MSAASAASGVVDIDGLWSIFRVAGREIVVHENLSLHIARGELVSSREVADPLAEVDALRAAHKPADLVKVVVVERVGERLGQRHHRARYPGWHRYSRGHHAQRPQVATIGGGAAVGLLLGAVADLW